jgi:hypothetical protein
VDLWYVAGWLQYNLSILSCCESNKQLAAAASVKVTAAVGRFEPHASPAGVSKSYPRSVDIFVLLKKTRACASGSAGLGVCDGGRARRRVHAHAFAMCALGMHGRRLAVESSHGHVRLIVY